MVFARKYRYENVFEAKKNQKLLMSGKKPSFEPECDAETFKRSSKAAVGSDPTTPMQRNGDSAEAAND